MGKSYTYRYQVGREYAINNTLYHVAFSSSRKDIVLERARKKGYTNTLIRKDFGSYALLVPVRPSFRVESPRFGKLLQKYSENAEKLGLI